LNVTRGRSLRTQVEGILAKNVEAVEEVAAQASRGRAGRRRASSNAAGAGADPPGQRRIETSTRHFLARGSPVVEPALAGRPDDRAMIRLLVDPCDRRRAA